MAWNELKDGIVKENIKMTDEPPIVKILNKGLSTKADLSEKDYVAMAGFGKDSIVEKINKELTNKFKNEATPVESIAPDGLMIYSFLYTNLEFKKEFESLRVIFPEAYFDWREAANREIPRSLLRGGSFAPLRLRRVAFLLG